MGQQGMIHLRSLRQGQSLIEYLLMLAAVVGTIVAVYSPSGFMTQKTETSLNQSLECLHEMARCVLYDANGNPIPPQCNNDCCEPGENKLAKLDPTIMAAFKSLYNFFRHKS